MYFGAEYTRKPLKTLIPGIRGYTSAATGETPVVPNIYRQP